MAVAEVVVAVVTLLLGLTLCTTTSSAAAAGTSARRWREEDCGGVRGEVTYDHRALVLNGTRRMLFAGEMHYPRSTPEATQVDACAMCLYDNHGSADAGHPPSCRSSIVGCGCLQ